MDSVKPRLVIEHDPYIELLRAILDGRYGKGPLTPAERIAWMATQLPKTSALLGISRQWEFMSDLQENLRP